MKSTKVQTLGELTLNSIAEARHRVLAGPFLSNTSKKMPVSKNPKQDRSALLKATTSATSAASKDTPVASSVGASATRGCQRTSQRSVKCAVCKQNIVEGKDQALFCKGNCQQWFHRYCAGVSAVHFETLSSSPQPFHCVFSTLLQCRDDGAKRIHLQSQGRGN